MHSLKIQNVLCGNLSLFKVIANEIFNRRFS